MKKSYRTLLVVGISALLAATASASTVYSAGFENPPFVPGSIIGQDGWLAGSSSGSSQSIVNTFAYAGTQSLFWDNSTTFNSFYSVRRAFDGQNGAITATTPLEISVWLYVDPSTGADRLYGTYATNSGTGTLGSTALGLTISGTGDLRAGTSWSATYSASPLYTNPALVGNWVKVLLSYDGVGGGVAVYDAGLNTLFSTTFATVSLANANGAGVGSWNINLGADYNTTTARLGMGYHDNLDVSVVPEPASLLALGGLALLALRRR